MEIILTPDGGYLNIFQKPVIIDYNLPKWKNQEIKPKDDGIINFVWTNTSITSSQSTSLSSTNTISFGDFLEMDRKDFNIYIGKRVTESMMKKAGNPYFTNTVPNIINDSKSAKKKSKLSRIVSFFRENVVNGKLEKEEVYKINVLEFFDLVKLTCEESAKTYMERIKPYVIAMKNAEKMGQQALVDNLAVEIFNNKFESILHAEGFHHKISEQQIVDFVHQTEKGVRLTYIKNFSRPVPDNVIETKLKADDLLVFDNYCVMYYDPELKSYKMTKEEQEALRKKKTDPILFGMISGSNNLYYVADWIDEYCDLTLEEFIKVSGLDKKDISIDEKINL